MSEDDPKADGAKSSEPEESWLSRYGWDLYLLVLLVVILALIFRWFATRASNADVAAARNVNDWTTADIRRRLDVLETIVRIREKEAAA